MADQLYSGESVELMVMGFISLLLSFLGSYIPRICILENVSHAMLPCPYEEPRRKLLSSQHRPLAANNVMSSEDKPTTKEGEEEQGGFLGKVKEFISDIGEKIEEAVGFGKPTADVTAIHIPFIDLKKADLVVDVLVANPNPIPIPLVDINYTVESDGRKLVSGLIPDAGTVHAHGSETIKIPLTLIYDDIKQTYDDIKSGSIIPYKVIVELIVDVPVIGNITLPMEKTGEIPVPYKPNVDLEKVKFDQFSWEETSATLHLKVDNENDFDLGLNSLECEVWLADMSIGGARLSKSANISKKGQGVVELPITFKPKDFGSAMWEMIRGRGTGYSMKGCLDVDTPFGPMKLPFNREGGNTRLKNSDDNDDED
ncbi:PREDICTED: uncharacterized protein LOC104595889 isoform X2 [Nelumbo nucifera]|uniref:Uncharacterized protein LOC104595889 isoform X2 n=1 Tax=Nelumbo nucifera TaxID=4432 RepID=A0A1U8A1Z7_NELNU|nr:PREDICTED: uncharacterized protein LOC104595889 isoform X2 [Nelumbo nucifera]